jgi:hypothetical protein
MDGLLGVHNPVRGDVVLELLILLPVAADEVRKCNEGCRPLGVS